jgi:uncharacterized protein YoxC
VSAFVVLALAAAVTALAVMVLVARELLRNMRKLNAQVKAANERLVPLTEELQSELAVTSTEVDALTRHVEQAGRERAQRARQRRARKPRAER